MYTISYRDELGLPFDTFKYGTELFGTFEQAKEWIDKVRFFLEECDSLQGFHVLGDSTNAFGGILCQCLKFLQDEYESKNSMLFSVTPKFSNGAKDTLVNRQLKLNQLLVQSKSWDIINSTTPIDVNRWEEKKEMTLNEKENFHSSAFIAGTLQTITSPYRCRNKIQLKNCIQDLVIRPSLKQTLIASSFPLPGRVDQLFNLPPDILDKRENRNLIRPYLSLSYSDFMKNMSYKLKRPTTNDNQIRIISEWGVLRGTKKKSHPKFKEFVKRSSPCARRSGLFVRDPIILPHSFPFNANKFVSSFSTLYTDTKQHEELTKSLDNFQNLITLPSCFRIQEDIGYDEQCEIREHLEIIRDSYKRP